MWIEFVFPHD